MTTMETKMLHERWKGARGCMAPEWRDDFEAYKRWCIEHGWTPDLKVRRAANGKGLLGPDTARIVYMRPGRDKPVKPGYGNRPCIGCTSDGKCCNPCQEYLRWYNATMEAYRKGNGL